MKKMKALSIKQPWAWLIVAKGKNIENRSWKTEYRGRFFIHASLSFDWEGYYWLKENMFDVALEVENHFGIGKPSFNKTTAGEFGGIIGSAYLSDCVMKSESPWFFGPYGFVLEAAKPCEFVPYKGSLGFFEVGK